MRPWRTVAGGLILSATLLGAGIAVVATHSGAVASPTTATGGRTYKPGASELNGWRVAWQSKVRYLSAVACPTISECFAVGNTPSFGYILRTRNDGVSWSSTTVRSQPFFDGVACVDANHCVLVGGGDDVTITSDGGDHWEAVQLPRGLTQPTGLSAVSCVARGSCYAVAGLNGDSGGMLYASADDGQKWRFESFVHNSITAMTCASPNSCIGVGSVAPSNDASVWPAASRTTRTRWFSSSKGKIPPKWLSLTAVSCLSVSRCYATGLNENLDDPDNQLLVTRNLGQTWKAASTVSGLGGLTPIGISCPTSTSCVAGTNGQSVLRTDDGGLKWARQIISGLSGLETASTIACADAHHCMAIESGDVYSVVVEG
jgi:photosystem II stability/assembly factor-like uncharacterized protein